MTVEIAQTIWLAVAAYFAAGGLFALYFVRVGADRIDDAAKGAGFFFRLLLFPGAAALWPLLLVRLFLAGDR